MLTKLLAAADRDCEKNRTVCTLLWILQRTDHPIENDELLLSRDDILRWDTEIRLEGVDRLPSDAQPWRRSPGDVGGEVVAGRSVDGDDPVICTDVIQAELPRGERPRPHTQRVCAPGNGDDRDVVIPRTGLVLSNVV